MFVDAAALCVSSAPQPLPRGRKPPCALTRALFPARIVVSLQYSFRFPRRSMPPSHYAAKISVRQFIHSRTLALP